MNLSDNGIALLKTLEGFRAKPYPDSGGKLTVGYGHLIVPGDGVGGSGDVISDIMATALLQRDVASAVACVNDCVKDSSVNQNEFDALVIFTYNVGNGAFRSSTLLRLLVSGDHAGAANQFLRWDRVGGVSVMGLHNRRLAEQTLFLQPLQEETPVHADLPQQDGSQAST